MVCDRCIASVENELKNLNLVYQSISLGTVMLSSKPTKNQYSILVEKLKKLGFDVLENKKEIHISEIKSLIIQLIHKENATLNVNLSTYLSSALKLDYVILSALFSEIEKTTIEKYFIAQKIERVKELLEYNEHTLSELAFKLNYSSTAHLSNQFKKVTGYSPSEYKKINTSKRNALDKIL